MAKYPNCELVYCNTLNSEHEDNERFLSDIATWTGKQITIIKSDRYDSIDDVFMETRYMSGVNGARCTTEMKKLPRQKYSQVGDLHIFGYTADEGGRIKQFERNNPDLYVEWILRDQGITKADCYNILNDARIALPEMYRLGFDHNNCWGCVKASTPGYWNRVRKYNPQVFARRCWQSRMLGVKLVIIGKTNGVHDRIFLDELDPELGLDEPDGDIECGPFCQNGDQV